MNHLTLCTALLCLFPPLPSQEEAPAPAPEAPTVTAGAQDGAGAMPAPDPEALAVARDFAKAWPMAAYTIVRGKREVGVYVQKNTMSKFEDEPAIEFVDHVTYPKASSQVTFQTICALDRDLSMRGIMGKLLVGQFQLRFTDGRAQGVQVGQTPVDMEVPESFLTNFTLHRGTLWLGAGEGFQQEYDFVDLESVPNKGSVQKGTLSFLGTEIIDFEGTPLPCRKFRWQVGEERPTFLWYGDQGQLLQKLNKKEYWTYSPSLTTKRTQADEPVGPAAGQGAGKKRKKGQRQNGR